MRPRSPRSSGSGACSFPRTPGTRPRSACSPRACARISRRRCSSAPTTRTRSTRLNDALVPLRERTIAALRREGFVGEPRDRAAPRDALLRSELPPRDRARGRGAAHRRRPRRVRSRRSTRTTAAFYGYEQPGRSGRDRRRHRRGDRRPAGRDERAPPARRGAGRRSASAPSTSATTASPTPRSSPRDALAPGDRSSRPAGGRGSACRRPSCPRARRSPCTTAAA